MGATGEAGTTGATGEAGTTGATGEVGTTGATGVVSLGNVVILDSVNGPYTTLAQALDAVSQYGTIWIMPGTYTITKLNLTTKSNLIMKGISKENVIFEKTVNTLTGATLEDWMISLGVNTCIENVTMNLILGATGPVSGNFNYEGCVLYYGQIEENYHSFDTSYIESCNLNIIQHVNENQENFTHLYGVVFNDTLNESSNVLFNTLRNCNISVVGDSIGNKICIYLKNTNKVNIQNVNALVTKPTNFGATGATGANVYTSVLSKNVDGDTGPIGSVNIRNSALQATLLNPERTDYQISDIYQNTPNNPVNPAYLSPGINIGPGVDLVSKTAGNKSFQTYVYPTILYFCIKGATSNPDHGFLWPGTLLAQNNSNPDRTNPPPRYTCQQKMIVTGIMITAASIGTGGTTTVTLCKNALNSGNNFGSGLYPALTGGIVYNNTNGNVLFSVALTSTDSPLQKTYYKTSVTFEQGDYINLWVYTDKVVTDLIIQLDCF
jgi:hypothetical protein